MKDYLFAVIGIFSFVFLLALCVLSCPLSLFPTYLRLWNPCTVHTVAMFANKSKRIIQPIKMAILRFSLRTHTHIKQQIHTWKTAANTFESPNRNWIESCSNLIEVSHFEWSFFCSSVLCVLGSGCRLHIPLFLIEIGFYDGMKTCALDVKRLEKHSILLPVRQTRNNFFLGRVNKIKKNIEGTKL